MDLKGKLRTGALAGLMGLTVACPTMGPYETRDVCNSLFILTPGILEPRACGNARAEIRARDAEDRYMQRERSSVDVMTPEGYKKRLSVGHQIEYQGEIYAIGKIDVPYIYLEPRKVESSGRVIYDNHNPIQVPIEELDILKK